MMLTTASQIHFDQVNRRFPEQTWEHVGVTSHEVVDLLGSIVPLGIWRLDIDTGLVFWSEDAARIHGMAASTGSVSLVQMLTCYHPEDVAVIEELLESATNRRNGFRFVMRVKGGSGSHRLIAVAGRFRAGNGGELIGYCHEYHDMVRAVLLEEEAP
jgi:PAS domain-containing protein